MRRSRRDDPDDGRETPSRRPDGRWPTLDAAERAIRRPGPFRAVGPLREDLLDRRAAAEEELNSIDQQLAAAVTLRRELVERIEDCNLAIVGTGEIRGDHTGEVLQVMRWHKRIPFVDEPPPVDEPRVRVISGRRLAAAATALLEATDQTLSLWEIERLLRLQSLVPAGRPSQTISDALRAELRHGRVVRVQRGWYRAA